MKYAQVTAVCRTLLIIFLGGSAWAVPLKTPAQFRDLLLGDAYLEVGPYKLTSFVVSIDSAQLEGTTVQKVTVGKNSGIEVLFTPSQMATTNALKKFDLTFDVSPVGQESMRHGIVEVNGSASGHSAAQVGIILRDRSLQHDNQESVTALAISSGNGPNSKSASAYFNEDVRKLNALVKLEVRSFDGTGSAQMKSFRILFGKTGT